MTELIPMYSPKKCKTCQGKGEVPWSHSRAVDRIKNYSYLPSGEVIADSKHSFCGDCHGTGMRSVVKGG